MAEITSISHCHYIINEVFVELIETNYQKLHLSCWLTFSVIYWTVQCIEDYYSEVSEDLHTYFLQKYLL